MAFGIEKRPSIKTALSVPADLFDQGEAVAAELGLSRSGLYASALKDYLKRLEHARIRASLEEAYAEPDDPEEKAVLAGMSALHAEAVRDHE